MAKIVAANVEEKINAFFDSKGGQRQIRQKLQEYQKNDIRETGAGSIVLTDKFIDEYADKLIQAAQSAALSYDLPESVQQHFLSMKKGRIKRNSDGSFAVEISFADDLSRPSLEPAKYGGVDNIVAVFNNGYPADEGRSKAISRVFGWWHKHWTFALGRREGLHFMQSVVNDFNREYGEKLGIWAEVGEDYKT